MKKKTMLTKLTSVALAAALVMAPTVAYGAPAESSVPGVYTSVGTGSVTCQASVGENFTVTLPVTMTLNNNQAASLPVSVQGDLVAGQTVKVVPANTVAMQYVTDDPTYTKETVNATVTAGKTEWTYEELFGGSAVSDTATTIMVSGLTAGSWVGALTYDISLVGAGESESGGSSGSSEGLNMSDEGISYRIVDGKYYVDATASNIVDLANAYSTLTVAGTLVSTDNIYYDVTIPAEETEIVDYAFSNTYYDTHSGDLTGTQIDASHINFITFAGDNVITIGNRAFAGTDIVELTIPDAVTTVGENVFANCTSLKDVYSDGTIANADMTLVVDVVGLGGRFHCTSTYDYYVEKNTSNVVMCVEAANNGEIKSLIDSGLPTSVTFPGQSAMSVTYYDVTVPDGTTVLDDYAFAYYEKPSEGYDDYRTSYHKYNILHVSLPNTLEEIGQYSFVSQKLAEIVIPDSVKYVRSYAFYKCYNTDYPKYELYMPSALLETGVSAFSDITTISYVHMDNATQYTTLSNGIFSACSEITGVTLPNSLTTIEKNAFFRCNAMTSIVIPNSVATIGAYVFATSVTDIYYSGSAEDDGSHWGASSATVHANNTL